jgi:hypothetical protein
MILSIISYNTTPRIGQLFVVGLAYSRMGRPIREGTYSWLGRNIREWSGVFANTTYSRLGRNICFASSNPSLSYAIFVLFPTARHHPRPWSTRPSNNFYLPPAYDFRQQKSSTSGQVQLPKEARLELDAYARSFDQSRQYRRQSGT